MNDWKTIDTLDDRREVGTTLARLSPDDRLDWLGACCEMASRGKPLRIFPDWNIRRLTLQARGDTAAAQMQLQTVREDFHCLLVAHGLDPARPLELLTQMVRRSSPLIEPPPLPWRPSAGRAGIP